MLLLGLGTILQLRRCYRGLRLVAKEFSIPDPSHRMELPIDKESEEVARRHNLQNFKTQSRPVLVDVTLIFGTYLKLSGKHGN